MNTAHEDAYFLFTGPGPRLDMKKQPLKYQSVLKQMDKFSMKAKEKLAEADGPKPCCQKGCSACCYQPVITTIPEILMLAEILRLQGKGAEVLSRLQAHNKRTAPLKDADAYWQAQIPCPFLSTYFCGIFPWRPVACRALYSFDVWACEQTEPGDVPYWAEAYLNGAWLQESLTKTFARSSFPDQPYLPVDFITGLEITLCYPKIAEALAAGKDPFRPARLKGNCWKKKNAISLGGVR